MATAAAAAKKTKIVILKFPFIMTFSNVAKSFKLSEHQENFPVQPKAGRTSPVKISYEHCKNCETAFKLNCSKNFGRTLSFAKSSIVFGKFEQLYNMKFCLQTGII